MQRMVRTLAAAAALIVTACAQGADARPIADSAPDSRDAAPLAASLGVASNAIATVPANGTIRFEVAPTGNAARYRVREQLVKRDLPNDAIGETKEISGAITVDSTGALVPGESKIVVKTGQFVSDEGMRDRYVRGRLLQVDQHPTVELVPTALRGLPRGLLATTGSTGPVTFDVVADLTVRGVTKPTTWRVTATRTGGQLTGTATTKFTFADFSIAQPRVPVLLSVADTIGLEYDFTLARQAAPAR